jgi:hypothetical protein
MTVNEDPDVSASTGDPVHHECAESRIEVYDVEAPRDGLAKVTRCAESVWLRPVGSVWPTMETSQPGRELSGPLKWYVPPDPRVRAEPRPVFCSAACSS